MPIRITELPALSGSLALNDLLEIVDVSASASKSCTVEQFLAALNMTQKAPVRIVLPEPVTLAFVIAGSEWNGVELSAGDRFMAAAQITQSDNGIWVVGEDGDPPTRPADFAAGQHAAGAYVAVLEGDLFADTVWMTTADPPTDVIGTNALPMKMLMGDAFSDARFRIHHAAELTATLAFDLSHISADEERTIIAPDADVDLRNMVNGPASATTTAIVVYDGTTGKIVKSTNVLIDGNNKLTVRSSANPLNTVTWGVTSTLNANLSNIHRLTLTGDTTLQFSNTTAGQTILVRLTQDTTGGWEVTWPAGISWPGDVVPQPTPDAEHWDWFAFICISTGVYDGFLVSQDYG